MLESLDDPYRDRQAEVKPHLLSKCLERLINIVGRTLDINEFVYVGGRLRKRKNLTLSVRGC